MNSASVSYDAMVWSRFTDHNHHGHPPQKAYLLHAAGQTPEARVLSRGADTSSDNEIAHLPA